MGRLSRRLTRRLTPERRRDAIVRAALSVARRKGLAGTTVRDVAAEMGTSSGLIHHYFATMDDVLAAAFERVAAAELRETEERLATAGDPLEVLREHLSSYGPVDSDWAFQLWLDAWAEAARRPALQALSSRLNLAWVGLLERAIRGGVRDGLFTCPDPRGAAWRIQALVDGLALQLVAHPTAIRRDELLEWSRLAAERELGLPPGTLALPEEAPRPAAGLGAAVGAATGAE